MASTRIVTATALLAGIGGLSIFAWKRHHQKSQTTQNVNLAFTPLVCPTTASIEKTFNLPQGSINHVSQHPDHLQIKLKSNTRSVFFKLRKDENFFQAKLYEDVKIITVQINELWSVKPLFPKLSTLLPNILKECKTEVISIKPANGLTYLITKDNAATDAIKSVLDKSGISYALNPRFHYCGEAQDQDSYEQIYLGMEFKIRSTVEFNHLIKNKDIEDNKNHVITPKI